MVAKAHRHRKLRVPAVAAKNAAAAAATASARGVRIVVAAVVAVPIVVAANPIAKAERVTAPRVATPLIAIAAIVKAATETVRRAKAVIAKPVAIVSRWHAIAPTVRAAIVSQATAKVVCVKVVENHDVAGVAGAGVVVVNQPLRWLVNSL